MRTVISKLEIENEMDLVLAHKRAMQIAKFAGIGIPDQTRFATAISEISRNALENCGAGTAEYGISSLVEGEYTIDALISDCGNGIKDLDNILKRNLQTHVGKGRGIAFSKKLVDVFKITSNDKGTKVFLGIDVPVNGTPINNLIIQSWINHLKKEQPLNAYEELKIRNANLMQLTEELRQEKLNTEHHLSQIAKLNDKLQKTNEYLEEFAYTVSHDLKTPLTSINLSLHFLDEVNDPESKIVYIDIIARAAKRLERTVQGLVEIIDVQTQNKNLAKKINLEEFFTDLLEEFKPQIDGKNILIEHSFMVNELCFLEAYLNSILTNLLSNSIKYRQPDQTLKISVTSRRKEGMVLFTITDNAEGIDLAKNGTRLFTPFNRFNTQTEGKGIGLYIIKKMVEKNDGRIEVESEKGKGTTFRLYLKEYSVPK
ncbi:MAG: sensor histidine kinase [Ferruginibacter sp.]